MTMKNDAKFQQELTSQFKTDMRNLISFDPSNQKSQKFALQWAAFDQSIKCLSLESSEVLCLIALNIDTEFEGKLSCTSENDMRNLTFFCQGAKSQNWDFDDILLPKVENI